MIEDIHKEVVIPILWKGIDINGPGQFQFYNVSFTEDFGPFKKNEFIDTLYMDHEKGLVEQYDDEGNVVKGCRVKYTVVEA